MVQLTSMDDDDVDFLPLSIKQVPAVVVFVVVIVAGVDGEMGRHLASPLCFYAVLNFGKRFAWLPKGHSNQREREKAKL